MNELPADAQNQSPEPGHNSTTQNSKRIAVIGGDGIGPEVTEQAMAVLREVTPELDFTPVSLGAAHWLETGETLNPETLETLKTFDAILFGAVGADPNGTRVPSGLIERELLLALRFSLDHGVNLRPSALLPGATSPLQAPGEIDFVVVREGTEGPYVGNGGTLRHGTEHEVATEVSVNTAYGIERVVRYAFELASTRSNHVSFVHKHNVLVHAGHLWKRIVEHIAAEYPQVRWDYLHVDAATIFLVQNPAHFDVIVTDNLFGDILTDLAGAITGGIGLAASGNINTEGTFPSMFEPVHGSAPDIAGQNKADPSAAILSAALLLRHLGDEHGAGRIEDAVREHLLARADNGGNYGSTVEVGSDIVARLA